MLIASPLGPLWAEANELGLMRLEFTREAHGDFSPPSPILDLLRQELEEYFAGRLRAFSVPIDLQGTEFQLRVWKALLGIPWGQTRTYTEQTAVLGDPLAIRAVASANGKNPIAIVVPCHRVVGSDGSLTGYAGGLENKRALLQLEGWKPFGQAELFS